MTTNCNKAESNKEKNNNEKYVWYLTLYFYYIIFCFIKYVKLSDLTLQYEISYFEYFISNNKR
jgi:hypothetical protein